MRKSLFLCVFLLLCAFTLGYSFTYENNNYKLSAFKGWELINPEQVYIFEGIDYWEKDELYDFVLEQGNLLNSLGKRSLKGSELKKLFSDQLIPVIVNVLIKERDDSYGGDVAINSISTNIASFRGRLLKGWEKPYGQSNKIIGAYYFIDVPENFNYEVLFLIPKEVADDEVNINFEYPDVVLTIPTGNLSSIKNRIDYFESEISRLRDFLPSD